MQNISPADQNKIRDRLLAGNKIAAVKFYRKVTGCNLTEAVNQIESYMAKERLINPQAFQTEPKQNRRSKQIIIVAAILLLLPIVFFSSHIQSFIPERLFQDFASDWREHPLSQQIIEYWDEWLESLEKLSEKEETTIVVPPQKPEKQKVTPKQNKEKRPYREAKKTKDSLTALQILEQSSRPHLEAQKAYPTKDFPEPLSPFEQLYQQKLASYDYQDWKSLPGLPKGYQDFPEEEKIKQMRSQIAAEQQLPEQVSLQIIPRIKQPAPTIDGKMVLQEWKGAVQIPLHPFQHGTTLLLLADQKWLYLALDAPQELTKDGYDQFRFYYHINLTPEIKNERIHVRGRGGRIQTLGGIRQTHIRWYGDVSELSDERWKKYAISDWKIYQFARGASQIGQHRQYEAKILLAEAGLHTGVPFSAYAIVETDPLRKPDGKFKKRQYLGKLGSKNEPLWFMIR